MGHITPQRDLFVIKLSGSLFFSEHFVEFTRTIVDIIRSRSSVRLVLISGGGSEARKYIEAARKLGADKTTLDEIGIAVSRLNAKVLAAALGDVALQSVPTTLSEIVEAVELNPSRNRHRVVVMGGLHPGQSTNAVGALVSEKLRAERFFNATDVDGVYTEDPRKSKNAKKLSRVSGSELAKILKDESMEAGGYDLMDPVALKLIERSKIPTTVLRCDANSIRDLIMKKKRNIGTQIISDSK